MGDKHENFLLLYQISILKPDFSFLKKIFEVIRSLRRSSLINHVVATLELPSRYCTYLLFSKAGQMAIIPNFVSHGANWVILQCILELSFVCITSGT